ncbi:MAG: PilZ domain-containing protein [Vulcanimicrobiota bacterium]
MKTIQMRKESRQPVQLDVRSVDIPGYRAVTRDLSFTGAQLEYRSNSPLTPEPGQSLHFEVALDGLFSRAAEGLARVAWVRRHGKTVRLGLTFERVGSYSRQLLDMFTNNSPEVLVRKVG